MTVHSTPITSSGLFWRRHRSTALLLATALPAVIFLLVFYITPMALLFAESFEGGTFKHFEKALTDGLYVGVLVDTLVIAACVSVVCLLLGYPVAYFLASTRAPWPTIGIIFVLLPFWTSILVRTYGWMILLGRNGIVNRALIELGLIGTPLPLLNNINGVLIGMVHVLLPYMVFPIYAVMRRIDPALLAAAEGLGAPGWQIFRRIYFPLTLPGVLAGVTLVFIVAIGFFITPALLGGGKVITIAVLIETQVRQFLNWGFAAALSAVLLGATLLVYHRAAPRFSQRDAMELKSSATRPDAGLAHRPPCLLRPRLPVPDGAADRRLPDLLQLFALSAVPAAGLVAALVRCLHRGHGVDRRHATQPEDRRRRRWCCRPFSARC